jgi:DNA-binding MarR family transcriptional regulator
MSKYHSNSEKKLQYKSFIATFRSDHPLCKAGMPWQRRLTLAYIAYKTAHGKGATLAEIARATGFDRRTVSKLVDALKELKLIEWSDETRVISKVPYPEKKYIKVYWMATQRRPTSAAHAPKRDTAVKPKVRRGGPSHALTPLQNFALWKLVELETTDPNWGWDDHRLVVLGDMIGADRMSAYRATKRLEELNLIDANWVVQHDAIKPEWYVDRRRNRIKDERTDKMLEKIAPPDRDPPKPPDQPQKQPGVRKLIAWIEENLPPDMLPTLRGAVTLHVSEHNADVVRINMRVAKSQCETQGTRPTTAHYLKVIENGKAGHIG